MARAHNHPASGKHKPRCDFVRGRNAHRRAMQCRNRATIRFDVDECKGLPELEGSTFRCSECATDFQSLLVTHGARFVARQVPS